MQARKRILQRPTIIGALLMALLVAVVWALRPALQSFASAHPAFYPAAVIGAAVLMAGAAGALMAEALYLRRAWLRRAEQIAGLPSVAAPGWWRRARAALPDPLEWLAAPFLRTVPGGRLAAEWNEAGMGEKASRYLLLLAAAAAAGALFGDRLAGPVLGLALALLAPLAPRALIRGRAEANCRRFGEQLPGALDSLAAGLSAGLSFEQAIGYALEEMPQPAREVFARLDRRIRLGTPIDAALGRLLETQPDESLALVVDGLILQREFGGDLVGMLEDAAGLLRGRVELEREVRAITTQGRLSGWVIAALVPVSAGFLLAFNPRYIDVLFDTLIGQVLIVVALLLQVIGWAIISRLVRIRY